MYFWRRRFGRDIAKSATNKYTNEQTYDWKIDLQGPLKGVYENSNSNTIFTPLENSTKTYYRY
jgi:hypothetical protein